MLPLKTQLQNLGTVHHFRMTATLKYTSVLHYILAFFFFLLVHVCGVRKRDFQSEMRNLAEGPYSRLPGIPGARKSQILCTKNAGHHHAVG